MFFDVLSLWFPKNEMRRKISRPCLFYKRVAGLGKTRKIGIEMMAV